MDPPALTSLAGSLLRAGLPSLAAILGAVVPPPFNLVIGPAFSLVKAALGLPEDATPAAVQQHVDADPADAQAKLHEIDAAHAQAASELQAYLADVQNARAMETALAAENSPIQWGAPVVSTVAVLGFVIVAVLVMTGHGGDSGASQLVLGAMITGWTTVIQYWLGSSKGGSDRAGQITTMLGKAINSGVPTSNAAKRAQR